MNRERLLRGGVGLLGAAQLWFSLELLNVENPAAIIAGYFGVALSILPSLGLVLAFWSTPLSRLEKVWLGLSALCLGPAVVIGLIVLVESVR